MDQTFNGVFSHISVYPKSDASHQLKDKHRGFQLQPIKCPNRTVKKTMFEERLIWGFHAFFQLMFLQLYFQQAIWDWVLVGNQQDSGEWIDLRLFDAWQN